jgi:SAM-dependent methyltransferase
VSPDDHVDTTNSPDYSARLERLSTVWWKRLLDVQRPYRWKLRHLEPGFTLDVGCGIGRRLGQLDGDGVGIDHNPAAVDECRTRGFAAFTPDEFASSEYARPETFDSILSSHVLEHLPADAAVPLLATYVPYLRADGQVIVITPQERGFRSDPTHVTFPDAEFVDDVLHRLGLRAVHRSSFPFPRVAGRWFTHNETVVVARRV